MVLQHACAVGNEPPASQQSSQPGRLPVVSCGRVLPSHSHEAKSRCKAFGTRPHLATVMPPPTYTAAPSSIMLPCWLCVRPCAALCRNMSAHLSRYTQGRTATASAARFAGAVAGVSHGDAMRRGGIGFSLQSEGMIMICSTG
mgnify:CR=1 FL=1